jgi:thiamine biosynthesis lipoprotein
MTVPISTRRHDARAMGTTISLYGPDVARFDDAAHLVMETFSAEERRFSRFRGDSELSRINATAGSWTDVTRGFAALLDFALDRAAATDGLFDPTVLRAMEAAGYDRDIDEVIEAARGALHPPVACGRWREIEVLAGSVRLPNDVGLDLGGVAKGWTVDLATEAALGAGLPWLLVSAGGDLRIAGDAPLLEIPVEDPDEPVRALATLRLRAGALATSSTRRRSWGPGLHHVIDPRSGAPSATGVEQATVWAPTCAEAEIASTVALLEGAQASAHRPSLIIGEDGTVYRSFADGSPRDDADEGVAA